MKRTMISFIASLALSSGTAALAAGAPGTGTARSNQGQTQPVTGVVTKLDAGKRMLTVVAPSGTEIDITNLGKTVFVDRGVDLVSVQAPVEKDVQVWRDGKQASFSSLKEGDVVRASFDPAKARFSSVSAVSQNQIDKDASEAQAQLKKDLDSQLSPPDHNKGR